MDIQFSLRPATTDDVSKILEIEQKLKLPPWTEENLRAELVKPYSHFLVMTDDQTDTVIAGYLVCWTMYDECQILNIVVDLEFRGLGLAKFMIGKIFSLATKRNIRKVVLEVRKSNAAAVFLYQKMGFSITHVRKRFYSDGEDAYAMTSLIGGGEDLAW